MTQFLQSETRENWWLRLAAPPGAGQYEQASSHSTRTKLRQAKLTAYVAPFVFIAPLFFIEQAFDFGTRVAMVGIMAISVLALFLNRAGKQVPAALLLTISLDAMVEGALITAPGGLGNGWIPSFYLFLFPLCVVGVLLQRRYIWMFLVFHIVMILGDFYLLPHAADLQTLIAQWHGPTVVLVRPVLLQIGIGLLCFFSVKSTDEAIKRADRAQFIASLQASIAEEKKQLEEGIQELLVVLTNAGNGHYTQSTLPQDNTLWQISLALNTLFARLQSGRVREQQVLEEMRHLTVLIQAARRGEVVQWPANTGGPLDSFVQELRYLFPGSVPSTRTSYSRKSPSN